MMNQKDKTTIIAMIVVLMLFLAGCGSKEADEPTEKDLNGGWGPERTTYTNDKPAPYATFNSITDNAGVGDERNFVRVGEVGVSDPYTDEIEVVPGKDYEVYIYFHNDAASEANEIGLGIATNTRVASSFPETIGKNKKCSVSGTITWSYVTSEQDESKEGKVWDGAYFYSKEPVNLSFVEGSATIHNDGEANGSTLPTSLFSDEGTPIGYNKLAGTIPGCAEYSGHITYQVHVSAVE